MTTQTYNRQRNVVKDLRKIRDEMSQEIMNMTFEEERVYLDELLNKEQPIKTKAYSVEKIREKHKHAYMPWTEEDDNKLELLFCEGKSTKELSELFGRNKGAINSRIKKLELKVKYGR